MKKTLIILIIIVSFFSVLAQENVYAVSSDDVILARINNLYSLVGNNYFTVDRESAGNKESDCLVSNVIATTWFQEKFGIYGLSTSQFPTSARYPGSQNAYSCTGFSLFAEWFIFKNSDSDTISTNKLEKTLFNYSNISATAKVGDLISLSGNKYNTSGEYVGTAGHEFIFLSANANGVTVLDSNWGNNCKVTKHTIGYYYCDYFQIARATNRDNISSSDPSTPEEPETCTHSYWRSVEAVHPHREYMVCSCGDYYYTGNYGYRLAYESAHSHREYYHCEVESCELHLTYTGNYGISIGYEDVHSHREYTVCIYDDCEYNYSLTGNYGTTKKYESVHPHREYYDCKVESCELHRTYTGNYGINIGYEDAHSHREYTVCVYDDCEYNYSLTGNYGTTKKYESVHPHREYYDCKVESCELHRTYTGNYGVSTKNVSTYPYKEYYVCPVACSYDKTYTGKNALPGKPSLNNMNNSYLVGDSIKLQWNDTINTTHYNFYVEKLVKGSYERIKTMTRHYATSGISISFDEAGKYRILLQSTNSNYWTEDKSTWLYTDADWLYFSISEKDTPYTSSTVTKNENILEIYTEPYNLTTPYDILIVGYKENQFITMKRVSHNDQNSPCTLEGDIDEIKVMVWTDLSSMQPLCNTEIIDESEFIIQ